MKNVVMLVAFIVTVFFTACKKHVDAANSIAGNWTLRIMEDKETFTPSSSYYPNFDSTHNLSGKSVLSLNSNGTFTLTVNAADAYYLGTADSGTYSTDSAKTKLYLNGLASGSGTMDIKTLQSGSLVLYNKALDSNYGITQTSETTDTFSR